MSRLHHRYDHHSYERHSPSIHDRNVYNTAIAMTKMTKVRSLTLRASPYRAGLAASFNWNYEPVSTTSMMRKASNKHNYVDDLKSLAVSMV